MNSKPFYDGMKKHFNITKGGNKFLDSAYLSIGKVSIHIVKFDGWLHEQIGSYEEEEGLSMKEAISKYYGEPAASFIQNLI